MKARVLTLLQGLGIVCFGAVCITILRMKWIGGFFSVFGIGIVLSAVFGSISEPTDE